MRIRKLMSDDIQAQEEQTRDKGIGAVSWIRARSDFGPLVTPTDNDNDNDANNNDDNDNDDNDNDDDNDDNDGEDNNDDNNDVAGPRVLAHVDLAKTVCEYVYPY
jgi:hypothetical protein